MRDINVIKSDISKLEAELADVTEVHSAQTSAVNILKNLGWKRVGGRWDKPKPTASDLWRADDSREISKGDWVYISPWKEYGRVHSSGVNAVSINTLSKRQIAPGITLTAAAVSVPRSHLQRVTTQDVRAAIEANKH